jgi:hypothetical protein
MLVLLDGLAAEHFVQLSGRDQGLIMSFPSIKFKGYIMFGVLLSPAN